MCDDLKMTRVLVNVLSNALKFTPRGGKIVLSMKQEPPVDGVAKHMITVKDTGIGMSEEFCRHAFEEFERERTSTESGIKGTGLGLANIPIIAITANAFEEDRQMALEVGMNGHLVKPIRIDELYAEMEKYLLI